MERIGKLKAFLETAPGDSFLQHALALEYIKIGEETRARELFEAILAADPAYIGSYYHLGKLLERTGDEPAAIAIYEKGMAEAKKVKDNHSYNELMAAYEELVD